MPVHFYLSRLVNKYPWVDRQYHTSLGCYDSFGQDISGDTQVDVELTATGAGNPGIPDNVVQVTTNPEPFTGGAINLPITLGGNDGDRRRSLTFNIGNVTGEQDWHLHKLEISARANNDANLTTWTVYYLRVPSTRAMRSAATALKAQAKKGKAQAKKGRTKKKGKK